MKIARFLAGILGLGQSLASSEGVQSALENQRPTPQMIEEAEKNPNGWVYAIHGSFGPNDAVPPEAIAGAWQVDSSGRIIEGSFKANPNFKGASP